MLDLQIVQQSIRKHPNVCQKTMGLWFEVIFGVRSLDSLLGRLKFRAHCARKLKVWKSKTRFWGTSQFFCTLSDVLGPSCVLGFAPFRFSSKLNLGRRKNVFANWEPSREIRWEISSQTGLGMFVFTLLDQKHQETTKLSSTGSQITYLKKWTREISCPVLHPRHDLQARMARLNLGKVACNPLLHLCPSSVCRPDFRFQTEKLDLAEKHVDFF